MYLQPHKRVCFFIFTVLILMSFNLTSCDEPKSQPAVTIKITIDPPNASLQQGGEQIFTATVTASDGNDPGTVKWSLAPSDLYSGTVLEEIDPSNPNTIKLKIDKLETAGRKVAVRAASTRSPAKHAEALVNVIPGTPVIPDVDVSINPLPSTMAGRGAIIKLKAVVSPLTEAINWSISPAPSQGTKIDKDTNDIHSATLTIAQYEAADTLTITAASVANPNSADSIEIRILKQIHIVGFSDESNGWALPGKEMTMGSSGTFTYTAAVSEKTTFRFNINGAVEYNSAAEWFAPDNASLDVELGDNVLAAYKGNAERAWALPNDGKYFITLDPANWIMNVRKEGVEQLPAPAEPELTNLGIARWTALSSEDNVTAYEVKLFRDGIVCATERKEKGVSYEIDFLSKMREGAGSYAVTVTAIGNNTTSSNSMPSALSAPQTVTQRPQVTVLNWSGDAAVWSAGTGDTSSLGYLVKLYRNGADTNIKAESVTSPHDFSNDISAEGNGTYTFTVTALGNTALILDAQESAKSSGNTKTSGADQLDKPTELSLSEEGMAAWTYQADANTSGYRLHLYKGSAEQGSLITISKGTFSYDFLSEMRTAGEGAYTFTVTALGNGTTYSTSEESDKSNERVITKRQHIRDGEAVWWHMNGELHWLNPDGGLNSGGNAGELIDYTIQVYTHKNDVKTPLGEPRNAERKNNQSGDSTWSDYNLAYAGVPAETGVLYSVEVTPKGYGLVIDAEPTESPQIYYTVFGNSRVWTITQGGSNYAAGAENGKIGWSDDGVTWTLSSQTVFDSSNSVRGIAYRATPTPLFVAVGGTKVAYSSDGKEWTAGNVTLSGGAHPINSVIYDGTKFVAVGNYGQVLNSSDGIGWTQHYQGGADSKHLYGIAYGDEVYIASGEIGRIITSTNGTAWTFRHDNLLWSDNSARQVNNFAFGNNLFVVAGENGQLKTSTAALINTSSDFWMAWTLKDASFGTSSIYNVVFSGTRFFAVGEYGRLSYSDNGETWTSKDYTQTGYGGGEVNNEAYISAAISLPGNKVLVSGNEKSNGWGKMTILDLQ